MKLTGRVRRLEEMALFALFGALMYLSAQIDIIPNVHPLALFIVAFTVVYRVKALIPLYLYVFLEGWMGGFNSWWYPYLYIWTVLWLLAMLIPRKTPEVLAGVLLTVVATLHGAAFGLLYMPFQCYVFCDGNWELAWLWTLNGLPFDLMHAVGDFTASLLAIPLIRLLCRLQKKPYPYRKLTEKHSKN